MKMSEARRKVYEKRDDESYDTHARRIAQAIHVSTHVERGNAAKCPKWEKPCKHAHGLHYRVTLRKLTGETLTFDYWNSMHDRALGKDPDVYAILSIVASEASCPTDPDDVAAEFGEMRPSQAIAIAEWASKLQKFFTREELDLLGMVQ